MSVLIDELNELAAAFNDAEIDFALCRGLAMAAHGFVRTTLDINFSLISNDWKMKKVDMSESAVLRRLRQVDQLRELCLALMKAKPISNAEAAAMRAKIRGEKADNKPPNT
jgi:hypothetical protein